MDTSHDKTEMLFLLSEYSGLGLAKKLHVLQKCFFSLFS